MSEPTHFYLLTLQIPGRMVHIYKAIAIRPGVTREQAFEEILAANVEGRPELAAGAVVFFSLEPNAL